MLKKWVVLFLVATLTLVACHSPVYNQTEANVADVTLKTKAARQKFDAQGKPQPPLLMKQGLYVDTTPISLARQPSWLQNRILIRGDQLPFSYYSRTIAAGAGNSVLTKYQTGLDPAVNVTMNYSGSIKGALDLLATKTGYVYAVRGKIIYWQAFVTRTYEIAFMPGGTDYLMGRASGGGGSGGGASASGVGGTVASYTTSDYSNAEFSNIKGTLSIWKDLESTVKQMLSSDGKMMVSESTTSITVKDRPTNVELVGQYIHNLNNNLSKQVLIKVQILDVILETDYNFGIDWGIVANAFNKSPFQFQGNYGTPLKITTLTGAAVPQFGTKALLDENGNPFIPSYTILFNALNQQGKTSIVSEPRVLCLNNQVSVIRITQTKGYAASVQNTTGVGGGGSTAQNTVTSQITPGTVETGLTIYLLPKILKDNIYLQVNADLSTLDAVETFGPDPDAGQPINQIQLPKVTMKHFNQRSMMHSGDTIILSGFRQVSNAANANQLLTSQALGGKASAELNRETIVLITPYVLNGSP